LKAESQFNTAGGSEFQMRGPAVLNDHLANDVRRNKASAELHEFYHVTTQRQK